MSKRTDECDRRIDVFVRAVNASRREPLNGDEIPALCRRDAVNSTSFLEWQIVPSADATWLSEVESRLPYRLPATFRSLIARYLFPSFSVEPLTFYSVGVTDPQTTAEFRQAIFADRHLSTFLFKNGFLPFARPADWNYDPVCFDYRSKARKTEPSVVRIDHEEILCNSRLRIVETLSAAFYVLLEDMTKKLRSP